MPVKKTKTTKESSAARAPKKRFYHHHFPMIPLGSWILFWVFILITILFSTVCFTNVLDTTGRYTTSTATNGSLAKQLALEAKVAELQKQIAADTADKQPTPKDECYIANTTDPADSHVYYVDPQTSVSMSLPYSVKWGASGCIPTPIDITESTVLFGPNAINGSFLRDASIRIASSTDSNTILRQLRAPGSNAVSIRQSTISGMTVISYIEQEMAGDNVWEAFGRNYHYTISSQGWLTDAEAIKIIQSLKVVK